MKWGLKTSAILLILSSFCAASADCDDKGPPSKKVAAGWFAGWHEDEFPATKIPWGRFTDVIYAFANTTPDPAKLDESGLAGLPKFVALARQYGVRPSVSIGGWGGSRFFSTAVGSASNRTAFVKTVTELADKYKVDSIEFDWEAPTKPGIGCNTHDINDTANFLLFLQELRAHPVGKGLTIRAAVGITPWLGREGTSITDVSGFAKVLDFVFIMNYDVWGLWSLTVGPNAPVEDSCAPGSAQMGSAASAVQAWKKAGMPVEKMVLGVPAYGHSYRVSKRDAFVSGSTSELALYPKFDKSSTPAGTKWDGLPGEIDVCGVKSTSPGGIIQYWGMIALGYLDREGNVEPGRVYKFDSCSKTPFIYDPEKEIMVSYDDPQSMRAKGQFIKAQNLGGFSMWELGGDYYAFLVDAIRSEF